MYDAVANMASVTASKFTSFSSTNTYTTTALVLPENERAPLRLSASQTDALKNYVSKGGVLILASDRANRAGALINKMFNKSYGSPSVLSTATSIKTSNGKVFFEDEPDKIPTADATWAIGASTVTETEQMYVTEDRKHVTVSEFRHANGTVIFLAFDWYTSGGSGRSRWDEILEAAVRTNCGGGRRACASCSSPSTFLDQQDYQGSDLIKGGIQAASASECCKKCNGHSACSYWTFGTSGTKKGYASKKSGGVCQQKKDVVC
jgi:hypothetical protein